MLKNLYNTFISETEYIKKENGKVIIDEKLLFRLHSYLTDDLVENRERGVIRTRPVRITGTEYTPPKDLIEIQKRISEIMELQERLTNPFEKALFLH